MFDDYTDYNLKIFSQEDEGVILSLSKALDPDDILDAWDLTKDELKATEAESDDYRFFMTVFKRGRLEGKVKAVHTVIDDMSGKNGAELAIRYLKQFSDSWATETSGNATGLNLKLILDDNKGKST